MIIRTFTVTPFQQNARVLYDPISRESLIIDPGGDIEEIFSFYDGLDVKELKTPEIFLTHAHIDHAGGVSPLSKLIEKSFAEKPKMYSSEIEKFMRENLAKQALMFGLPPEEYQNTPEPDYYLKDGDSISLGQYQARALFTPGHSPGHFSLYFAELEGSLENSNYFSGIIRKNFKSPILLAGDALFAGSIGRTDLPGGDHKTLINSIRQKLFTLPNNTIVLSGHGEDTTIGKEKTSNPFVRG